jgi:hypothetical protein
VQSPQAEAHELKRPLDQTRVRSLRAPRRLASLLTGAGRWLAIASLFSVAAVVQTWPLVLNLRNNIVDWLFFPFDEWFYIWSLWWVKYSLVDVQSNPFHTDLLLYPQGVDLHLQLVTVTGILSIPFQLVTGNLIFSANLAILVSMVLSGLCMYALAYEVTRNHIAAFVSGYIFAFSPFVLMHFTAHWNISTTWPIPLLAFFLVRFQKTSRIREAVFAGACWSLLTYNWIEYGADAGVLVGLFVAFWFLEYLRTRAWRRIRTLALGFAVMLAVWFVASSLVLIPAIKTVYDEDVVFPAQDEYFSGDLAAWVTPSPLWGQGTHFTFPLGPHLSVGSEEGTAYLGFASLILAALALVFVRRRPQQVLFWVAVFLTFGILSLGPYLYIDGDKNFSIFGISTSVPLPYHIYDQLPFLGSRRIPARMIIFGILGLSVLAGIGLDFGMSWLKGRETRIVVRALVALAAFSVAATAVFIGADEYGEDVDTALLMGAVAGLVALTVVALIALLPFLPRPAARYRLMVPVTGILVLTLVVVEYWNPPVDVSPLSTPAFLEEIAREDGDFTVVDAPLGRRTGFTYTGNDAGGPLTNYYQSFYERASFGGYVSRVKGEGFAWIHEQPGLRVLACPHCPELPSEDDLDRERVRSVFREHQIKYVVLHKLDPRGQGISFIGEAELTKMDSYLREVAGLTPVYSDKTLTVYRNPKIGREAVRTAESEAPASP